MRSRSRGDARTRALGRPQRDVGPTERRGAHTTSIALVLLAVSVIAFGIGAGIVSAIQDDLVHAARQIDAPTPKERPEEVDHLADLMERLRVEQERAGEADPPYVSPRAAH